MDERDARRYLDRIGAAWPTRPTAEELRTLQARHLAAVPFENLSIHLGEPIVLDEDALLAKIVDRRRGGFCYELNGAFGGLLLALGFPVTLLGARVARDGGGLGPPFDHLVLAVEAGGRWLIDVGFGSCLFPLPMDNCGEQTNEGGRFQLVAAGDGDMDLLQDGERRYRVEPRPRVLADFVPTSWWHATSPGSKFRRSVVCTRMIEGGMLTLSGRRLIRTIGDQRTETQLDTDGEVLEAYASHFGIRLDRVPEAIEPLAEATETVEPRPEAPEAIEPQPEAHETVGTEAPPG